MKRRFLLRSLVYLFISILFIITVFPIIYSLLASFKTNSEIVANGAQILPEKFMIENYINAWNKADFKSYTFNSIYMTVFVVIGTLILSSMGGYVFARATFKGKKIIFALFTSTMFISMGSITIYPLIQIAKLLHINSSLIGVIIIKIFGLNMVNTFLVKGFVEGLPGEIEEAAIIDGCDFFKIFTKITLPLIVPILATIAIITFKDTWNDYLLPMVFTMGNLKQAPLVVGIVALKGTGEGATNWNLMLAGTAISLVPMIILYLGLNKFFVAGMVNGAVKG